MPGDHIKTDRRDAEKLARSYRSGDLSPVWVPDAQHESLRDLVRAREAAKEDERRARHRLGKYLLRYAPHRRDHKTGNSHLRRVLVESAWHYRHRPHLCLRQKRLQKELSPKVAAIAWRAQERLHRRYWLLSNKSKPTGKIASLSPKLPDYALFDSLPGAGPALAPRLLVAFGERRERFPDAASLQKYVGVAPVTERSGNKSWVHWRFACPTFQRQTFIERVGQTVPRSLPLPQRPRRRRRFSLAARLGA
jgi:transposase